MTIQMVMALSILLLMIIMIMSDKFAFGAPPLFVCLLLVATGLSTVEEAFAGFINPSVIMIAGFMVVMAAVMKTNFMSKVQSTMLNLVESGGYKSYILLIIVVMLGASLAGGTTGYYVLVLTLIQMIPYNEKLPTSKLMLPLGFATNHALVPVNVAFFYGLTVSLLETAGYTDPISMAKFSIVTFILSVAFLIWSTVSWKLLPDHEVSVMGEDSKGIGSVKDSELPRWKEIITVASFIVSIIGMMMMNSIGSMAYVIPGLSAALLLFINVLNFKEVRDNMNSPVILIMACVIGVASALDKSGFTTLVGEKIATTVGSNVSPFLFVFVFSILTSTAATFTGSAMGSVFIFAPIAIATSIALNLNPVAAAVAITLSGWNGGYMPIDGLPAMILGMGNYSMTEFWKFSIPMYLIRILAISVGALLLFPM